MENQAKRQYSKGDYQVVLRKKAEQLYEEVSNLIESDDEQLAVEAISEVLRKETLRSWKNGIEAGKRQSAKSA